ncbi:MAG TPA: CvpA family protein [Bacteroidia bacterium]|jgi:membrane protein required for colicin V production|nr:CvpA family protein [Bacteroidia bacterium]
MKLNIILIIPLVWGFYKGFKKGLIVELASILAIILGVFICAKFSDVVASFLGTKLHSNLSYFYLSIVADIIVFIGILILVNLLAKAIQKVAEKLFLGIANKLLGGLFGALKWALLISVLLYFFDILNAKTAIVSAEVLQQSWVYMHLVMIAPLIMPALVKSKAKLAI